MGHPSTADLLRRAIGAGEHVLHVGPPGSGKRSAWREAMVAAGQLAHDAPIESYPEQLVCGPGTSLADLLVDPAPGPDGHALLGAGPLPRAMREGRRLLIEHFDRLDAGTTEWLREALVRRTLSVELPAGGQLAWETAPGFAIDALVDARRAADLDPALAPLFDRVIEHPGG